MPHTLPRLRALALAAVSAVVLSIGLATAPAGAQTGPPPERGGSPLTHGLAAFREALALVRTDADPARVDRSHSRGCVDAGPADGDVAGMVAEIFRCRLTQAGVPVDETRRIAAEAVVVASCESRLDPDAVVFDGRYRDLPHPNGNRYSAAGVFQFIRRTADRWIEDGGYANVHDPRRNIDAAARLYLHNRVQGLRGWEDWACAAANDGFKVGSVLPGWPGGPAELPGWAWEH